MIRDGGWTAISNGTARLLARLPGSSRSLTILEALSKWGSVVPDMPSWVQIETTNRCNFNCEMCPRTVLNLPETDMDMKTFRFILDRLFLKPGSLITLFGLGEPLIHPELFSMVGEVHEKGLKAGFTTNGVLLRKETQKKIIASRLDYLRISIDDDGFGHTDSVLHMASEKVIQRTRELLDLRNDTTKPEVLWNVVASAASAPSISGLISRAAESGVDGVNIINLVPRFSTLTPLPEDRRSSLFKEWHHAGKHHGVRVLSTFGDRFGISRFFYDRGVVCPQLLNYAYVTMDAQVSPCCHLPRVLLGDLRDNTLAEIWHNEAFRRFRKTYRMSSTCKNCRLLSWR